MIQNLNLGSAARWGLTLLVLLGATLALYLGESIFIPTTIALLLAAMLWPAVKYLHKRLCLPWTFACLLGVMSMVMLAVLVTLSVIPLGMQLLQDLPRPDDLAGQARLYSNLRGRLEQVVPLPPIHDVKDDPVFQYLHKTLEGSYITGLLWQIAWYANNWLWEVILILFLLLFLLMEGPILTRRVVEIFGPSREAEGRAVIALSAMAHHVRTYLVWRTVLNVALALLVGVVYHGMHLRQAWTWAFLLGVGCYVPYLGPIAAGVPPVIDAFLNAGPQQALAVLLFYTVLMVLEGYVIVPVVMGRRVELNATTMLLACLFWERIWGLPGLFLAMPLMAGIKAVCASVPGWEPWANLMSTREPPAKVPEKTTSLEDTQRLAPEELAALEASARPRSGRR